MSRREELIAKIKPLVDELNALDRIADIENARAHLGRYFRFRNSYSRPSNPGDYWWTYRKCVRISEDARLVFFEFETDKDGKISIGETSFGYITAWEEIDSKCFYRAFTALIKKVSKFSP